MSRRPSSKVFAVLLPIAAGIVLIALFVGLGRWQLGRAQEKARLFEEFDNATDTVVEHGPIENKAAARRRFTRIGVFGRYDADRQFLLDNMVSEGRVGYQVLTPLLVPGDDRVLLVNRGWIAMDSDRRVLPPIPVGTGERQVNGRIGRLPVAGLRAGPGLEPSESGWPRRAQFPKRSELEDALGYELFNYVLLLDPDQPDGYVREWRPTVMNADRHRAYALQWFAMAATVAILVLVLFFRRRREDPE